MTRGVGKVLIIRGKERPTFDFDGLLATNLEVIEEFQPQEIVRSARINIPDLIVGDLDLSQIEWLDRFAMIRENLTTRHIPIMVVSATGPEDELVAAYQKGVDDVIWSPFLPREFVARIHSKLRRVADTKGVSSTVTLGSLVLNLDRIEAFGNGGKIVLSLLEFKLLRFFVEHEGKVLSRRRILEAVWKDSIVSDRTVDTHIACLRRKLTISDYAIMTIYGAGYTLKSTGAHVNPQVFCQKCKNTV